MSQQEQATNVEGQSEGEKTNLSVEDLMSEIEQLKSTKERLLRESKDYANKYRALRDEIEQKERASLEKSENHRALYEKAESKNKELLMQLETMSKKMKEKEFLFQIAKYAPDARDVLLVAQKLPKELVQWNEETSTFEGIEEGVKAVRKSCGFLFDDKKNVPMVNQVPTVNKVNKDFKSMTLNERKQALEVALENVLTKGR